MARIFPICAVIKSYEWGKLGSDSCVANFQKAAFPEFDIVQDIPYAELWMGTHVSGASTIPTLDNITLSEWIKQHPESLGSNVRNSFSDLGLPFLFKVLSVRKSLSIQVHPDKPTAEKLHKEFKHLYPDDNHKPEMAVALTKFEALCGFRLISQIKAFIMELPHLQTIIGNEIVSEFLACEGSSEESVKMLFVAVMTYDQKKLQSHMKNLIEHFENDTSLSDLCKSVKALFLTLNEEYAGDVGCLCVFFMNYLILDPGQAIFIAANEPHAYLKGDCIECMACSDNVVRAGLTPKFKDVETLCKLLTYQCKSAVANIFPSSVDDNDKFGLMFNPPIPEFAIVKILVPKCISYALPVLDSASILLVVEGNATALSEAEPSGCNVILQSGSVIFISSNSKLEMLVDSTILMYRAYCTG